MKARKETKKLLARAARIIYAAYGLAETEKKDQARDPVFYHPGLNEIRVWSQFNVLMPEEYGWIEIGAL